MLVQEGAAVTAAVEGGGTPKRHEGCAKDVDLAKFFRCTPRTIWRWSKETDFPKPFSFGTKYTAWRWEDVYRFVDQQRAKASAK